ncbi:hypothetical protein VpaJT1_68 [Vibrio phage VpaJT_1]|nr:hypothetical protein VpaJT1_68 [Vibrio phage VpaJT_1]
MTWLEFKQHCEAKGVQDDTGICFIDVHRPNDSSDVDIHVSDDNELTVWD